MSQQENIYELPLFKAHVLLLADIVADFSGRTELAEKGKVKELFLRQVKTALVPDATEDVYKRQMQIPTILKE